MEVDTTKGYGQGQYGKRVKVRHMKRVNLKVPPVSYTHLDVYKRQGKYRAILKYKDVVPMQEVTMEIVIDAASKSVSIVETSNN